MLISIAIKGSSITIHHLVTKALKGVSMQSTARKSAFKYKRLIACEQSSVELSTGDANCSNGELEEK